jgi:dTDP-L-rhamnose 4-epimerase
VWERNGVQFYPGQRTEKMLSEHRWDFEQAHYLPMSAESTLPRPTSIYGATKLAQENMLASWCNSFGVQMKTTRLQNVYGAGQSLYNSSTGIVTLFARMARKHKSIPVYEDGNIVRDFIYIDDIARGIARVLESEAATGKTIDLGTGVPTTIMEAAGEISQIYGAPYPHITGQYRNGDVRAAVCDVSATESLIGWRAAVDLHEGLGRLCAWVDKKLDAEEHITDFKDR